MSDIRLVTSSSLRVICKQDRRLDEDCVTSDKVNDRIHRGISVNRQDSRSLDIALDSPIKADEDFPSLEENMAGHAGLESLQLSYHHQNVTGTQGQGGTDREKYLIKGQNAKEITGIISHYAYPVLPQDKPKAINLCGEIYSSSAKDGSECTVCQIPPASVMDYSADIWKTNQATTLQTGNGAGIKRADVAGHEDTVCQERGQRRLRDLDIFLILMTVVLSVICVVLSVTCFHLFTRVVSLEHHCKNDVNIRTSESASGRTSGGLVVHQEVPHAMLDLVYTQRIPESPTAKQRFALALATKTDRGSENLSRTARSPRFDVFNSVPVPEAPSRRKRQGRLTFDELNKFQKKCKKKNKSRLATANFVGKFFDHFDYQKDFLNKTDCHSNERWGHPNVACKETTIQFRNKGTPLPFFMPIKTKIIHQSEPPDGRFHVQSEGLYLINLNITIKDNSREHFLALYLNDVAVLACEGGGFACPKRGSDYRICNIHGMLELAKNDQVEIRTMHSNTTLRLETFRTPYFKFVRLTRRRKRGNKTRNKNTRTNKS